MITRKDINWKSTNQVCFVCRKDINNIKYIAITESLKGKATSFDSKCFKSIRVCLGCWKDNAGEDWMFAE